MKFLILALAIVAVALADQAPIAILRQAQDISPDGSYNHAYEAENGISVSESGAPGPLNEDGQPAVVAQGQFQYTAPDGSPISLTYTADESGFHPQGDHLPVGPPVPPLIQKALDFIAGHPPQSHGIPPVSAHARLAPPRKVPGRPNFPSQATRRF